ncbi:hypothetical protein HDIA_0881 [Hartmannibacter diazotrophicus]|uniref:Uncharacterized protein n=1 Tax=Hartmannibacter diazotrophicus TaxID=1482074 RepID=A0A2C9D268_9HYPH|nr:hypothetical protein [Hartmannibacter diazotrophicus]SON54422.1 hypothetical protein HDIA_0881 [Hartmannibacter diazotrophicus]
MTFGRHRDIQRSQLIIPVSFHVFAEERAQEGRKFLPNGMTSRNQCDIDPKERPDGVIAATASGKQCLSA